MQTKTFTLLVTVRDDGCAPVFNPVLLAAAVKGALETGCEMMLSSTDTEKLQSNPLLQGIKPGLHRLAPVVSAEVDAFAGDHLGVTNEHGLKASQLHAELRTA